MPDATPAASQDLVTYLFSDIEDSARLWERAPAAMRLARGRHDAICHSVVARHGGRIVKMTADGLHAAFPDAGGAVAAALALQLDLAGVADQHLPLRIRCGLHAGLDQQRDGDYFGPAVNRAARIMAVAHGGQVLLSATVAAAVGGRMPAGAALRDLGVARLRDLAVAERLYQLEHPQLRARFPPLRSLEGTPNNLPPQHRSFVGRERELRQLGAMLARGRLLALLGIGGIGKSRLALQLAAEAIDEFPDGVWLVELAPVSDPRSVAPALAAALGLREEPGRPLLETLLHHVADRQLLVVLDNCEHVIEACARLARQLLQAGPRLKVLVTSREPLRIAGEQVYPVPPLEAPLPTADADPRVLAGHAAPRLFIERACALRPDLDLGAMSLHTIARICHLLDGIPLALELAAARIGPMSLEGIAAGLADRFRLLDEGDENASPRQRTLRSLIDWSHGLLGAAERTAFARLSVFHGGWTLAAAEEVVAGAGISRDEVLGTLGELVDRSLVVPAHDRSRYRMLDTVRAYAAERQADAPDRAALVERHARHFCQLARSLLLATDEPARHRAWEAIDADRDNVLAGLRGTATLADGADLASRAVNGLRLHFLRSRLVRTGIPVFSELLERPDFAPRSLPRCRVLFALGQYEYFLGQFDDALRRMQEVRSLALEFGDDAWDRYALQMIAPLLIATGDLAAAEPIIDDTVARARAGTDRRDLLVALSMRALWLRAGDRLQEAAELFGELGGLAREVDDVETHGLMLVGLALVTVADLPRSRAALREAFDTAERTRSELLGCSILEVAALQAAAVDDWPRCAEWLRVAAARRQLQGLPLEPLDARFVDRLRARLRDEHPALAQDPPAGTDPASIEASMRAARHWLAASMAAADAAGSPAGPA